MLQALLSSNFLHILKIPTLLVGIFLSLQNKTRSATKPGQFIMSESFWAIRKPPFFKKGASQGLGQSPNKISEEQILARINRIAGQTDAQLTGSVLIACVEHLGGMHFAVSQLLELFQRQRSDGVKRS